MHVEPPDCAGRRAGGGAGWGVVAVACAGLEVAGRDPLPVLDIVERITLYGACAANYPGVPPSTPEYPGVPLVLRSTPGCPPSTPMRSKLPRGRLGWVPFRVAHVHARDQERLEKSAKSTQSTLLLEPPLGWHWPTGLTPVSGKANGDR